MGGKLGGTIDKFKHKIYLMESRKRIRDLEIGSLSWQTELHKLETLHETERLHWQEHARKQEEQVRSLQTERRLIVEKFEDCKEQLAEAKQQLGQHLKAKITDKEGLVRDLARVTDELYTLQQQDHTEKSQMKLDLDQALLDNNVLTLNIDELGQQLEAVKNELAKERELRSVLRDSPSPALVKSDDFQFLRKQLTDTINRCKQLEEDNQKLKNENLRYLAMYQNLELLREENMSLSKQLEHYEQLQNENIQLKLNLDQLRSDTPHSLSLVNELRESEKERQLETQLVRAKARIQELESIIQICSQPTPSHDYSDEQASVKQQLISVMAENKRLLKSQELLEFKLQSKDDELKSMLMETELDEEMVHEEEEESEIYDTHEEEEESEEEEQDNGVIVLDSD